MAKKKQSLGGKASGAKNGTSKSTFAKSATIVRRPPRHQGR
jgi:hypothetical protein